MRSFWWLQLYVNLFEHLSFHNLFHLVHGKMHNKANTCTSNVTRNTKLRGEQRSSELVFKGTEFCVPENLISPPHLYIMLLFASSIKMI